MAAAPPSSIEGDCHGRHSRPRNDHVYEQLHKLKFEEKNLRRKTRLLRNAAGGYFIALWTE